MGTGKGGPPPLKVDPELLDRYGNQLLTAAGGLPAAPPPFVVSGTDAISTAIADKLPAMEGALQEELPRLRADATQTASNIVSAAGQYQRTDQQVAADYEKHQFDRVSGSGVGAPGSAAVGSAGGADSISQMMSMPIQMASQAVQMPMQAMSALASVPQGVMQGVQQIGQMTGGMGGSDSSSAAQTSQPDAPRDDKDEQDPQQGATAGDAKAERAPEPAPAKMPVPQQYSPRHAAPDPELDL